MIHANNLTCFHVLDLTDRSTVHATCYVQGSAVVVRLDRREGKATAWLTERRYWLSDLRTYSLADLATKMALEVYPGRRKSLTVGSEDRA